MQATGPTETTFMPFTDNVAQQYANPSICGPRVYTIVEAHSFATIAAPALGLEFTDPWTLSITTANILDIGSYVLTI